MDNINITSAQYLSSLAENSGIQAVINGQEMSVPLDSRNRHYAEIMRQVEAGQITILEAD